MCVGQLYLITSNIRLSIREMPIADGYFYLLLTDIFYLLSADISHSGFKPTIKIIKQSSTSWWVLILEQCRITDVSKQAILS